MKIDDLGVPLFLETPIVPIPLQHGAPRNILSSRFWGLMISAGLLDEMSNTEVNYL